ncbi:hypothetical protein BVG81_007215, partial [Haliangium sp. UPWRP_2]
MKELGQLLNVDARVSLGFGSVFDGNAGFSMGISHKLSQYKTTTIARVQVVGQDLSLPHYLLQQWVLDKIRADPSYIRSGRFTEECGTGFISGYTPGGELDLLFSQDNLS